MSASIQPVTRPAFHQSEQDDSQKFPFDRRSYVLKSDVERIKQFVEVNRG